MEKTNWSEEKKNWDRYWQEEKGKLSLKKKIMLFVRNKIFLPEITKYLNKHFKEGVFMEAGSGSGSTASKLEKKNKKIIAMDLSEYALEFCKKNPYIDECIQGNILDIPLENDTLDGIWNAGVMEHLYRKEALQGLKEFRRVLKKNGKTVLFWPSRKLPVSWIIDQIINLGVDLPQAAWIPNKKDLRILFKSAGFEEICIKISYTLDHYIVIAKK